jgi:hypothetical protein
LTKLLRWLQLESTCYKKECFLVTIGHNGHLLGKQRVHRQRLQPAVSTAGGAANALVCSWHGVLTTIAAAAGMNWVFSGWHLGLANTILHAKNNESCQILAAAGYNNVTCVWSHK